MFIFFSGVVLKFTEPLDSAEPNEEWRLYCFKESETQGISHINLINNFKLNLCIKF
jgi:hypothetical protein